MPKVQSRKNKPVKQLKFEPDYMVYVQGGRPPQATHLTVGDAKAEAERLCRKENKPAFVYTATHCVQPVPSVLEWINGRKTS
jgi:hypothetical protein